MNFAELINDPRRMVAAIRQFRRQHGLPEDDVVLISNGELVIAMMGGLVIGLVANGSDLPDYSPGTERPDILIGNGGVDQLYGNGGDDMLFGGKDADYLYGGNGDDILEGGSGADYLEGGSGNDVYLFKRGDGRDVISEYTYDGRSGDALRLGSGISRDDVSFARRNWDLVIKLGQGDEVTIRNWFYAPQYRIGELRFTDGSKLTAAAISDGVIALLPPVLGGYVQGTSGADLITGEEFNDTLYGYEGNDTIVGGAGQDILVGGKGDDRLDGGTGDDIYRFALGDGRDTISDQDSNPRTRDILEFGWGILPRNTRLFREGQNLVIDLNENDRVTINRWFDGTAYRLEEISFADGTRWNASQIASILLWQRGTQWNDSMSGRQGYGGFDAGAGDDYLYGHAQGEIFIGGAGNDTIYGGGGNDVYLFNRGDGYDTIIDTDPDGAASGTLRFGTGIRADNVRFSRSTHDLVIAIDSENQVTIKNWFLGKQHRLSRLEFSDGVAMTADELRARGIALTGTTNDDSLYGHNDDDLIKGEDGNDYLVGYDGNDTLAGGTGNDRLYGGNGDDTYVFNRGDGRDRMQEYNPYGNSGDIVRFGTGIRAEQIWFSNDNGHLKARVFGAGAAGGPDEFVVENWFYGKAYRVEKFMTADGRVLRADSVDALVQAMAAFKPAAGANDASVAASFASQMQAQIAANWR